MDLLYNHITNIANGEKLVGIYIVNDRVVGASIKTIKGNYHLYTVYNYRLDDFLESCYNLEHFDVVIGNRYAPIAQQSVKYENNLKIVNYITKSAADKALKKSNSERIEISRYIGNNGKKLF